jgi:hypothetical protein
LSYSGLFIVSSKLDDTNINITRGSPKNEIDPEIKKLDILLKLGVGMVIVSGLIFSTSTWDYVSDGLKMLLLIVIGGAFIGLSIFSDKKLKIEKTTKFYWLIGMSFIFFSFLSIGYFGLLGEAFALGGVDEYLFIGSLLMFTSILTFVSYFRFDKELYLNSTIILIILGITYIFANLGIDLDILFIIINIILLALLIAIEKPSNVHDVVTKFFIIFTILNYNNMNGYLLISINLVLITSLIFILNHNKNSKLAPFLLMLNFITSIYNMEFDYQLESLLLISIVALFDLMLVFCNYKKKNVESFKITKILQNLVYAFAVINIFDDATYAIVGTSLILLTHIVYMVYCYNKEEKLNIELYSEPFKLALVVSASLLLLNIDDIYNYIIIFLVSGLMHLIVKNDKLKFEYFLFFIGFYLLATTEIMWDNFAFAGIILVTYSYLLYYYIKHSKDNFYNSFKIHSIILVLVMIYRHLYEYPIYDLNNGIKLVIVVMLYALIAFKEVKNSIIPKIVSIAIIFPFQAYINDCQLPYEFISVFDLILYSYSIFAIGQFFIQKEKNRDIFQSIAYSLLLISFIFTDYVLVGLVIGLISLVLILLGLRNDNFKWHFYVGVIFTILNIVHELREIWTGIRLWLYLLIGGLVLIFIATQKQMKKIEKK